MTIETYTNVIKMSPEYPLAEVVKSDVDKYENDGYELVSHSVDINKDTHYILINYVFRK